MKITRGHVAGGASVARTDTFTGEVWADPVMAQTDGVLVNNVFFTPGARTDWHRHEHGQLLIVQSGEGLAATRDGERAILGVGDVVFFPPGEEHWHGAGRATSLLHTAVSLGATEWLDPVSDGDYGA